jgi:hypothetical protein
MALGGGASSPVAKEGPPSGGLFHFPVQTKPAPCKRKTPARWRSGWGPEVSAVESADQSNLRSAMLAVIVLNCRSETEAPRLRSAMIRPVPQYSAAKGLPR